MKMKTSLDMEDMGSSLNSLQYLIQNCIIDSVNTMTIVRVMAVNGDTIDVMQVLQELSNTDEPIENSIIEGVRYIKWQYGGNCIDIVPEVGDVGIMVISKQDTSGLISEGSSMCQTRTYFNTGDGVYIGGLYGMNKAPDQFLQFSKDSVKITGTKDITIESTDSSNAGTITVKAGTVTVDANTVNLGGAGGVGVARIGDSVLVGGIAGTITGGSSKVFATTGDA